MCYICRIIPQRICWFLLMIVSPGQNVNNLKTKKICGLYVENKQAARVFSPLAESIVLASVQNLALEGLFVFHTVNVLRYAFVQYIF